MKNYQMTLIYLSVFFLFSNSCFAKFKTKIIEIKRTISLKPDQFNHKEFYINAGKNQGVKLNSIIPVVRKKTLMDPLENKAAGDLWLPVGELKVIHVGERASVARIYKVPKRDKLPDLDYLTFMIGDRLNLKKAYITKKKKSSKKKYSARNRKGSRGLASVNNSSKKVKNGNYVFPKNFKEELTKRVNNYEKGLELSGTSATGINTEYKITPK